MPRRPDAARVLRIDLDRDKDVPVRVPAAGLCRQWGSTVNRPVARAVKVISVTAPGATSFSMS